MTKPRKSDQAWYVLGVYPSGLALVLALEPAPYKPCARMLGWHRTGFSENIDWRIGYVRNGVMVDERGETVPLWSAPYTDQAWSGFLQRSGMVTPDAVAA